MKYQFRTTATMKPYNNKAWFIDSGIIRNVTVQADDLDDALKQYQEITGEHYGVTITDNALRCKQRMYVDAPDGSAQQVGYVLTGSTDFRDDRRYTWSKQYIDLWVGISIITSPFVNE